MPAVAGVVAGTALQQRIPEQAVAGAFVALLRCVGGGAGLLMDAVDLTGLLALGFAAGVAGGLLGVGGGVLFVPALVLFAEAVAARRPGDLAGGDRHRVARRGVAPA